MPNLVMLGAVDQVFEATRVKHAIDRITLPIDKKTVESYAIWQECKSFES